MASLFKTHLVQKATTAYKGGKSRKEVETDQPLFKLSSNENLLGSSPMALQAIRDHLHLLHEYPERKGESLQLALHQFYDQQLSPEQFITGNSGNELIELFVQAFLAKDLECIVSQPAFHPYVRFPKKVEAKVIDVPLEGAKKRLNLDTMLAQVNERTRVIWISSPNNPAGTYIPKSQMNELLAELPDHVVVVYDEVYAQFVDATDYSCALPYVLAGKNIIGLNSFSKVYGLAGLRIGYAYTNPAIAQYLNQMRRPFLLNTLAIEAAKAALQDVDFIQRTKTMVQSGKKYLYTQLDKLGIPYWKTQANFIMFKPQMDAFEFEAKMLDKGVMVRPVESFGSPGCVRVTIGTAVANKAFIEALSQLNP